MKKLLHRFARAAAHHEDIDLAVRCAGILSKLKPEVYPKHTLEFRYLCYLKKHRPKAYKTLSRTQQKNLDRLSKKIKELIDADFVFNDTDQMTLEEMIAGGKK